MWSWEGSTESSSLLLAEVKPPNCLSESTLTVVVYRLYKMYYSYRFNYKHQFFICRVEASWADSSACLLIVWMKMDSWRPSLMREIISLKHWEKLPVEWRALQAAPDNHQEEFSFLTTARTHVSNKIKKELLKALTHYKDFHKDLSKKIVGKTVVHI